MRILIAEDERITRRSLLKQLQAWGHEVVDAEDGAVAWEHFQAQSFDLVVTDWDMPRMDGRELIERIRGSGQSGYAYLIMLTGRSEKADLVAGMEAGADDFLAKPFDRNELRVRLNAGERIIRLERNLAARNEELSAANQRMKHDLEAAAKVQQALLPTEMPQTPTAHFAWHYEPCDELGGDILDVLPLDSNRVAMYLLDVSGHGVPAALLSVTAHRVLHTSDPSDSVLFTQNAETDDIAVTAPREVAATLNRRFPMESQEGRYFTMAYAVLETDTGLLHYVVAGHPPPILFRNGRPEQGLAGGNFPIGMIEGAEFEDHTVQLQPGDRLYFYSDGITEAANEHKKMLNTEGLEQLIGQARGQAMDAKLADLIKGLKQWCGAAPLADDVSLLALEIPDKQT